MKENVTSVRDIEIRHEIAWAAYRAWRSGGGEIESRADVVRRVRDELAERGLLDLDPDAYEDEVLSTVEYEIFEDPKVQQRDRLEAAGRDVWIWAESNPIAYQALVDADDEASQSDIADAVLEDAQLSGTGPWARLGNRDFTLRAYTRADLLLAIRQEREFVATANN